jgi:hypothetical protein
MNRRKAIKAVCIPVAVALGSSLAIEAADNPHVDQRQYEEEPRMTYDTPFTTTASVVVNLLPPSLAADIPVAVLRPVKKQ